MATMRIFDWQKRFSKGWKQIKDNNIYYQPVIAGTEEKT